jgi:hypothetical protein
MEALGRHVNVKLNFAQCVFWFECDQRCCTDDATFERGVPWIGTRSCAQNGPILDGKTQVHP